MVRTSPLLGNASIFRPTVSVRGGIKNCFLDALASLESTQVSQSVSRNFAKVTIVATSQPLVSQGPQPSSLEDDFQVSWGT